MEECKNCCYFGYSDDPSWIRQDGTKIEHCLFRELRGDYETAPCDEPSYDIPNDYYGDPDWDDC